MTLLAVLVDERATFLPDAGADVTLLTLPAVGGSVRDRLTRQLDVLRLRVAHEVMQGDEPADEITLASLLAEPLSFFDAFDQVLFVSARLLASEEDGLAMAVAHKLAGHGAVHLLASAPSEIGSAELVCAAPDGSVRRIQRYLDTTGRSLVSMGVIASLVPVRALLQLGATAPLSSLAALRTALVQLGVPSADVRQPGPVFDLGDQGSALAFLQHRIREVHARSSAPKRPGARGAVVIEEGADVADGVLLVGPTLICRGATVGAGARIAQSVLLSEAVVKANATVRHEIVSAPTRSRATPQRRHALSPTAISAEHAPLPAHRYPALKSWAEAALATVILVLLSPLLLALSLLVAVTSRGPVFYGDRREGLGARPFKCWKFRTMRPDAHALQRELKAANFADGPHFKLTHDPRLTSVGAWLRRLNLDELPQIFNVACREMSFVGPRPSPTSENQVSAPWRNARLSVRPGITGLWQVCRHDRADGDFHQWIEYDMLYVEHCSFRTDLKILIATVLTGGGRRPVPVATILPALNVAERSPSRVIDEYHRAETTADGVSDIGALTNEDRLHSTTESASLAMPGDDRRRGWSTERVASK